MSATINKRAASPEAAQSEGETSYTLDAKNITSSDVLQDGGFHKIIHECFLLLVHGDPEFRLNANSARKGGATAVYTAAGWKYKNRSEAELVAQRWSNEDRKLIIFAVMDERVDAIWYGTDAQAAAARNAISLEIAERKQNAKQIAIELECDATVLNSSWLYEASLPEKMTHIEKALHAKYKPLWDAAVAEGKMIKSRIADNVRVSEDAALPLSNSFLIEPGKTHLVANRGTEILSNPDCGFFQQFGGTVRIVEYQTSATKKLTDKNEKISRPEGSLVIVGADEVSIVKELNARYSWLKFDARLQDNKQVDFPPLAAKMILSDRGKGLPFLKGFVCCPTLREDGSVVDKPGYDEESGLFFNPCGTLFPAIPEHPTKQHAEEALQLLSTLVSGFPFENEISRSVALAEIMTGVVRKSVGIAPAFANDASTRSSGKTLLAKLPSLIATGKVPTMITPVQDEAEMEKRFSSAFIAGDPIICVDNVDFTFESRSMCVVLTSETWNPRVLGKSENARVSTNSEIIFTGNNLVFKGDLCTRILKCRIVPDCESPEERRFDLDLEEYIPKNRGIYVAAILTIIKAYFEAGCALSKPLSAFRTYGQWSKMVREPLVWLGLPDPYESAKEIKEADPEKEEVGRVFSTWHGVMRHLPIPSESIALKDLVSRAELWANEEDEDCKDALQAVHDALLAFAPGRNGGVDVKQLGYRIRKFKDRIISGFRLIEQGKDRNKVVQWRVVKI